MTQASYLNSNGEAAWLRLKQHLEWCDHFALGLIFTDHADVIRIFRQRLAQIYRARVTRLQSQEPAHPKDLTEKFLAKLLNPSLHQKALDAPIWMDLSGRTGPGWPEARLSFLKRLNEQREPLRNALSRPLVLVLPAGERTLIKKLVPDLWAIRDFSLVTESWLRTDNKPPPAAHVETGPQSFLLTDRERSHLLEWKRLQKKQSMDHGMLLAAAHALKACLRVGRYSQAAEIASHQEKTARKKISISGETPESLRDLSVSLDNVGQTAQAMGKWANAQTAFEESLEIRRQLIKRVGETPESLRDLSVSLNYVGQTAQAMGKWANAQTAFEESLEISRQLIKRVGETPESLRDLSVSLDNVGQTAQAMGKWANAQTTFEEGLTLATFLAKALPDHVEYQNLPDHFEKRLEKLSGTERK